MMRTMVTGLLALAGLLLMTQDASAGRFFNRGGRGGRGGCGCQGGYSAPVYYGGCQGVIIQQQPQFIQPQYSEQGEGDGYEGDDSRPRRMPDGDDEYAPRNGKKKQAIDPSEKGKVKKKLPPPDDGDTPKKSQREAPDAAPDTLIRVQDQFGNTYFIPAEQLRKMKRK